jgi:phosphate uptake regulator
MEYLKSYKVFEKSDFIDKDDVDELLDKIKELYINDINQKFNYVYNRDIAIKFLFDVLFNFD